MGRFILKILLPILLFSAAHSAVISTTPAANESNAPTNTVISATFDTDMDPAAFTPRTFKVKIHKKRMKAKWLKGSVTYDAATRTASFIPAENLVPGRYQARISFKAPDKRRHKARRSYTWGFTIGDQLENQITTLSISTEKNTLVVGESVQISALGTYDDGANRDVTSGLVWTVSDSTLAQVAEDGMLTGLAQGNVDVYATDGGSGTVSNTVTLQIAAPNDVNGSNFTAIDFGADYLGAIPPNATLQQYDEKTFCMLAGSVKDAGGNPLPGVMVSMLDHGEYGSVLTNENGVFVLPAEGGRALTVVFRKTGYLTIHRRIDAPTQEWANTPDVTMSARDAKVTTVDLTDPAPQLHASTPVTDDRGTRATTLVFDGVTGATVRQADGTSRTLTSVDVRATEFETPESMPAALPAASAYTYCSDLQVDGVADDATVEFDAPVVMYVDNFLGFDVGEIVPVGYYDRTKGEWVGSDNGAVVQLLDTDGDGQIDALDSTGDGSPNDLNDDGNVSDEVAGLADNSNYYAGQTLWRAAITHFTPWDHNWPYGPPADAVAPEKSDADADDADDPCDVSVSSYVKPKTRVFHEDIPVAGTDITLHYSSKRVEGYTYIVDVPVDTTSAPASATGAKAKLEIGGRVFTKEVSLGQLNELQFQWDGKDALGMRMSGEVRAKITITYQYEMMYYAASTAWAQAWAQAGTRSLVVTGRTTADYATTINLEVKAETPDNEVANGWSLSNHHKILNSLVQKGDGTVIDKAADLSEGLKALYQFEGNANNIILDGFDASPVGNVQYSEGVIGQALKLDGSSHLSLPSFDDTDIQKGLSFSFWFKTDDSSREQIAISQYEWSYTGHIYAVMLNQSTIRSLYYFNVDGSGVDYTVAAFPDDNEWHHTVINSKSETLQTWIDGELKDERPKSGNEYAVNPSVQTYIGHTGFMGSGSDKHFVGELDDFRIYNRPLSDNEIRDIYNKKLNTSVFASVFTISDGSFLYVFNFKGQHTQTRDLYTQTVLTTFAYDDENRLISITDRFGNTTTITRDSEGKPTEITAPGGQKTYVTVDTDGNLADVVYEDGASYKFTYDAGSLMDVMTDPNENKTLHYYDENGRIIQETDAEGGTWSFDKSRTDGVTTYTTTWPEGEVRRSADSKLADGSTLSDISLFGGYAMTTTTSADEMNVRGERDGVESIYTYGVDPKNEQKTLRQSVTAMPSGLSKTTTYTTVYDGNETHTFSKTQTVDVNGKSTGLFNDYVNGEQRVTTPMGRTVTSTFDVGTLLTSSVAVGTLTPTDFGYDAQGRLTTESTGTRTSSLTYDSRGNVATTTDANNRTTAYAYDIMDRLTSVTYPDGHSTRFSYDANGNMTMLTVPTPADHAFAYNGVDKAVTYTSPLSKVTSYAYDKNRRLISITRPSGKSVSYVYTDGQLAQMQTTEGTTEYTYLFTDKVGTVLRGSESIAYAYDGDLLTSVTQQGVLNATIGWTYNDDLMPSGIAYAGETGNLAYDNDGLLTQSGGAAITRDAQNGLPQQVSDGTYTLSRTFNGYAETQSETAKVAGTDVFGYEITERYPNGQIKTKVETVNGVSTTYGYVYDDMGRLTEVTENGSVIEAYTYDANGNRTSATSTHSGITDVQATYNISDQLETVGDTVYAYDDDGYLSSKITSEGTTHYTYGTLGELKSVVKPGGTVIEYVHNAENQRVAKKVNGTITEKYLWLDLTTLLAVYDGSDNLISRFEYADSRMPYKMTYEGQTYYLSYDQVGTLRALTDTCGNIVKELTHDTFGNIISDSNPAFKVPFGFAGGLYDEDTELTRFGYRDYDAETGKWTAKDPIGFDGGDTNLYGYVLGDPVNLVDPEGLIIPVIPILIGAVVGAGTSWIQQGIQNGWSNVDPVQVLLGAATGAFGGTGAGIFAGLWRNALGGAAMNAYTQFSNPCYESLNKSELIFAAGFGGISGFIGSGGQKWLSTVQKPGAYGYINNIAYPVNTYHSAGNYGNWGAAIFGVAGSGLGAVYGP